MRSMMCVLIVTSMGLHAQDVPQRAGWLTVLSQPVGADVVVDSTFVGKTPLERFPLRAGKHAVRVFYPSFAAWSRFSRADTIDVLDGKESTIRWEFGSMVSLASVPSGSSVLVSGRIIGTTPFFSRITKPFNGDVLLQKEGYRPTAVKVQHPGYYAELVRLKPLDEGEKNQNLEILPPNSNGESQHQWVNYVAGSAMILSGFLAAYFKDQANRDFESYHQSQDPALLESTRRYDRFSGVSMTVTQVSFGILAYKLLLE